ncbi:MAG: AMP-binding protein, partial [Thermodesulfobacteriota bacterium]
MTVTLDQHNMKDYQETVKGFTWEIPEYYNFALDHFDKWTKDKTKIALITVSEDGSSSTKLTFWELSILANKFANVLNSLGMKKGDRVLLMLPRS